MYQHTLTILQNPGTVYKPIVPYTMDGSVGAITALFNYNENN
jgi:hypothetical protein